MKQSLYILFVTGVCASAAAILAGIWGFREDFGSAIGGVAGFALSNGAATALRGSNAGVKLDIANPGDAHSVELGFAYGVFAIAYFSFVGWLTGYVHQHGEFAGTVCGGLGGFMLAVTVPAIHRTPFMSAGRRLQLAMSVAALVAMLYIVWVMYEHEIR